MEIILSILNQAVREAISPSTAAVAIAVIGLNIHFGFTGLLNIGQAGFMLIGAYGFAISVIHDLPLPVAILIGLACGMAFALILGIPTLKLRGDYLAIVTISAAEIVRFVGRLSSLEDFTGASLGLRGSRYNGPFLETTFLPDQRFTLIEFNASDVLAGGATVVVLSLVALVAAVALLVLTVRRLLAQKLDVAAIGMVLGVAVLFGAGIRVAVLGLDAGNGWLRLVVFLVGVALVVAAVKLIGRLRGTVTGRQALQVLAVPYLLLLAFVALLFLLQLGVSDDLVWARSFGLLVFGALLVGALLVGRDLASTRDLDGGSSALAFAVPGLVLVGLVMLFLAVSVAQGNVWLVVLGLITAIALAGAVGAVLAVVRSAYVAWADVAIATGAVVLGLLAFFALFFTFPVGYDNNVAQGWWVRVVAWALVAISLLLVTLLVKSPWGRLLRGIREDEDAMRSLGKNVYAVKMQALVIGGVFGALGGMVYVLPSTVQPDGFGRSITFFAYTALLLGGAATLFGPVLGTVLFYAGRVLIQGVTDAYVPATVMTSDQAKQFSFIVVGVVLMLLIVFRPQGIMGDKRELRINV